ncbi:SH3 domain-containing protein [Alteromonas sp. CYL-A6]|uniref:SH3 domain-containing protein n=1 Tax=Alteromonas nitratireducens TaxID=3390813 RepID=UPI0034B5B18B
MNRLLMFVLVVWGIAVNTVRADEVSVSVAEPFAEMHTGPASEYPVFHVVERGEVIVVLKAHTGWYKVRTADGKEGWIARASLIATRDMNNRPVSVSETGFDGYQARQWEVGMHAGRLEDVNMLSLSAAWFMTENISAEVSAGQALGDFSDNRFWLVRLTHDTFPDWRASPYFSLGAGQIRTEPSATLVQIGAETRTSDLLEVGLGVRVYLVRNFVMRAEYKRLTALTARDELEELNTWSLGFSVFF